MNEPVKIQPSRKWSVRHWFGNTLTIIFALGLLLAYRVFLVIDEAAYQTSVINNARQTITAMKVWALDHDGAYPDSAIIGNPTANKAFRQLIRDDVVSDERIFGAHRSPFRADGNIGDVPDYNQAVDAGENHWMMIGGLSAKSDPRVPMVFENGLDSSWPPSWKRDNQSKPVRARTWRGGKVVIGFQDNSVILETLIRNGDVMSLPDSILKPKECAPLPPLRILDIEEKK